MDYHLYSCQTHIHKNIETVSSILINVTTIYYVYYIHLNSVISASLYIPVKVFFYLFTCSNVQHPFPYYPRDFLNKHGCDSSSGFKSKSNHLCWKLDAIFSSCEAFWKAVSSMVSGKIFFTLFQNRSWTQAQQWKICLPMMPV